MSRSPSTTTLTVAPFADAQAFATCVTAGARFASVQMTRFVAWTFADAVESATAATSAVVTSASPRRAPFRDLHEKSSSLLPGTTERDPKLA